MTYQHKTRYVVFFKSLPWLGIEIYVSNIAISFDLFIEILSAKLSCVTWAYFVKLMRKSINWAPTFDLNFRLFRNEKRVKQFQMNVIMNEIPNKMSNLKN